MYIFVFVSTNFCIHSSFFFLLCLSPVHHFFHLICSRFPSEVAHILYRHFRLPPHLEPALLTGIHATHTVSSYSTSLSLFHRHLFSLGARITFQPPPLPPLKPPPCNPEVRIFTLLCLSPVHHFFHLIRSRFPSEVAHILYRHFRLPPHLEPALLTGIHATHTVSSYSTFLSLFHRLLFSLGAREKILIHKEKEAHTAALQFTLLRSLKIAA